MRFPVTIEHYDGITLAHRCGRLSTHVDRVHQKHSGYMRVTSAEYNASV
jgi:hypothetical protein